MNAEQFYHVCRSAAAIANVRELTVFGAAAIVPWIARLSPGGPCWGSMEVDLDPGGQPLADMVDGSIGEGSLFEETSRVRAHGVTLEAFVAPAAWPSRAEVFPEPRSGVRIRVPHPVDLVVSKLVRGDDRDSPARSLRERQPASPSAARCGGPAAWAFATFCRERFALDPAAIANGLEAAAAVRPEYAAAVVNALAHLPARLPAVT